MYCHKVPPFIVIAYNKSLREEEGWWGGNLIESCVRHLE